MPPASIVAGAVPRSVEGSFAFIVVVAATAVSVAGLGRGFGGLALRLAGIDTGLRVYSARSA